MPTFAYLFERYVALNSFYFNTHNSNRFLMVKQISYFSLRPVTVGSAPLSLHAAGNAERGAYGSKYSDNHLQDSFPNFLFHFLFPFFF